jgi:hypothetical protein
LDISPLEGGISLEALISFYEKNDFKIAMLDDGLVEGFYTFK